MSLLDSLVGYWKMDEASGNALDAHGSNPLVDNGSVASGAGIINTSREFSGAGTDYFSHISNADLQVGDIDFTWAYWAWRDNDSSIRRVVLKGDADPQYSLYWDGGGARYQFAVWSGAGGTGLTNRELTDNLGTGAWHFIVQWHDAAANTINIQGDNGTVHSTAHAGGVYTGGQDVLLGLLYGGSHPWDGRIDEIGFWKRLLTAQERTDLYNGGAGLSYSSFGPPAGGLPFITRIGGKRV